MKSPVGSPCRSSSTSSGISISSGGEGLVARWRRVPKVVMLAAAAAVAVVVGEEEDARAAAAASLVAPDTSTGWLCPRAGLPEVETNRRAACFTERHTDLVRARYDVRVVVAAGAAGTGDTLVLTAPVALTAVRGRDERLCTCVDGPSTGVGGAPGSAAAPTAVLLLVLLRCTWGLLALLAAGGN